MTQLSKAELTSSCEVPPPVSRSLYSLIKPQVPQACKVDPSGQYQCAGVVMMNAFCHNKPGRQKREYAQHQSQHQPTTQKLLCTELGVTKAAVSRTKNLPRKRSSRLHHTGVTRTELCTVQAGHPSCCSTCTLHAQHRYTQQHGVSDDLHKKTYKSRSHTQRQACVWQNQQITTTVHMSCRCCCARGQQGQPAGGVWVDELAASTRQVGV